MIQLAFYSNKLSHCINNLEGMMSIQVNNQFIHIYDNWANFVKLCSYKKCVQHFAYFNSNSTPKKDFCKYF